MRPFSDLLMNNTWQVFKSCIRRERLNDQFTVLDGFALDDPVQDRTKWVITQYPNDDWRTVRRRTPPMAIPQNA